MLSAMSYFAFIIFIGALYPTISYALAIKQNVDKTFHIGYISGNRNKTTGKFEVFLPGLKIRYTRNLLDNRLKAIKSNIRKITRRNIFLFCFISFL